MSANAGGPFFKCHIVIAAAINLSQYLENRIRHAIREPHAFMYMHGIVKSIVCIPFADRQQLPCCNFGAMHSALCAMLLLLYIGEWGSQVHARRLPRKQHNIHLYYIDILVYRRARGI